MTISSVSSGEKRKGWKKPKFYEGGEEDYDAYVTVEKHKVFSTYHNSIVGQI